MRRGLLTVAAGVVLVANPWGFLHSWRNRSELIGGSIELTERELQLVPAAMDSTATSLRLEWSVLRRGNEKDGPPEWLDTTKLAELGFDCGMPLNSPSAGSHYSSMPARSVFLVLEYEGQASQKAVAAAKGRTRLFAVDAGLDPRQLRRRYPHPDHYIVCRGLVRLVFRDRDRRSNPSSGGPRIEGWIDSVEPGEVFVPLPHSRILANVRQSTPERSDNQQPSQPRYAVRVCWGVNYEPWVEGVRLVTAAGIDPKGPETH